MDSSEDILFTFWKGIPNIKYLNYEKFNLMESLIRTSFMKVLRRGIIDEKRKIKRYALNLKEILNEINIDLERSTKDLIPITTLYHHKDILLKNDLIQEVSTIKVSRIKTKYFGRTAKGFIHESDDIKEKDFTKLLKNIILYKNPGYNEVDHLITKIESGYKDIGDRLHTWIEENDQMILDLEIDIIDLYNQILPFIIREEKLDRTLSEIGKLLGI